MKKTLPSQHSHEHSSCREISYLIQMKIGPQSTPSILSLNRLGSQGPHEYYSNVVGTLKHKEGIVTTLDCW